MSRNIKRFSLILRWNSALLLGKILKSSREIPWSQMSIWPLIVVLTFDFFPVKCETPECSPTLMSKCRHTFVWLLQEQWILRSWTLIFTELKKKRVYLFHHRINFVFQVFTKLLPKVLSQAIYSRRFLHFLWVNLWNASITQISISCWPPLFGYKNLADHPTFYSELISAKNPENRFGHNNVLKMTHFFNTELSNLIQSNFGLGATLTTIPWLCISVWPVVSSWLYENLFRTRDKELWKCRCMHRNTYSRTYNVQTTYAHNFKSIYTRDIWIKEFF